MARNREESRSGGTAVAGAIHQENAAAPREGNGSGRRETGRSLTRWPALLAGSPASPWELMRRMSEEMNQLFDSLGGGQTTPARQPGPSEFGSAAPMLVPHIEVEQRGGDLVVRADLPGLKAEDINVSIDRWQADHLGRAAAGKPGGAGRIHPERGQLRHLLSHHPPAGRGRREPGRGHLPQRRARDHDPGLGAGTGSQGPGAVVSDERVTHACSSDRPRQSDRNWWAVALRGAASTLFGIITFVSPGISLAALVLLFGAYAFADGVLSIVSAVRRREPTGGGFSCCME